MMVSFNCLSQPPADAATDGKGGGASGEGGQDAEDEDEPIPCTPEPKEWICLGSDREIKEEDVTETRPLVSALCSPVRKAAFCKMHFAAFFRFVIKATFKTDHCKMTHSIIVRSCMSLHMILKIKM